MRDISRECHARSDLAHAHQGSQSYDIRTDVARPSIRAFFELQDVQASPHSAFRLSAMACVLTLIASDALHWLQTQNAPSLPRFSESETKSQISSPTSPLADGSCSDECLRNISTQMRLMMLN